MEKQLYDAAFQGNKKTLLNLLREDPQLLDSCVTGRYSETPLHVAAMLGHFEFVDEVVSRKPELAQELDSRKSSPLHLAAAKGNLQIVKRLLEVNPVMCLVCDNDGRNPLHIAAMEGRLEVLKELVHAKPWAARSLMENGDTILHACVREKKLEALKFLVEEVLSDGDFVNRKNRDGDTILHLAIDGKQEEAIRFLKSSKTVDLNCKNKEGVTEQDRLYRRRKFLNWLIKKKEKRNSDWVRKKYKSLEVVATLLAAMAFQACINPPGGVWQDDEVGHRKGTSNPEGGVWQDDKEPHTAGLSVWATKDHDGLYTLFLASNTIGFMASLSIILFQVSGLPLKNKFVIWILMIAMWVAISTMAFAYLLSIVALTPGTDYWEEIYKIFGTAMVVWGLIMLLLFIGHALRLIKRGLGGIIRLIMRFPKLMARLKVCFPTKEVNSVRETPGSNPV